MEAISSGVPIVAWPMFGDQHGDADLIVSWGCGLKIAQVDMSGQRIVEHEEILAKVDKVAQWERPLQDNNFFVTAQRLGQQAEAAVAEGGDSAHTFDSLLTLGNTRS
ncbi:hypothetical protein RvY_03538 [Ramazzottius varieornatus]|uniref:Uncharacterized protein n=1 Tax=Ramazzottius varieornatus TaxID=947166 RepID=A0A1D1UU43_RAMVA|nr:hypothetical protein RvY_03538 [Ramazzottius varieornatus]